MSHDSTSTRSAASLALPIFVFFAVFFAAPLHMPFFTRGEAREALVVQAMGQQQNLILPLRNGVDIPSKPPLFHWTAYALSLFASGGPGGTNAEFFIRLPSALYSALALALFFCFFSKRLGPRTALLAILILGSSLDWMRASAVARVDMTFSLWSAVATWLLFELLEKRRAGARLTVADVLLPAASLALAALTKGPAGLALPGVIAALYAALSLPVRKIPFVAGAAVLGLSVAMASVWYLAAYFQAGDRFLDVQLMRENVARIVGMEDYEVGHESGPLSIVPMILSGLLPWSFFLPLCFPIRIGWRRFQALEPGEKFSILWALFYLVFFACTASKRNVYLLPSFPAYAYLFSSLFDGEAALSNRSAKVSGALLSLFTITLFAAFFILLNSKIIDIVPLLSRAGVKPHDVQTVAELSHISPPILALLGGAIAILFYSCFRLFRAQVRQAALAAGVGTLILGLSLNLGILPAIASKQSPQSSVAEISARTNGKPLSQFRQDLYAVDYYFGRPVKTVRQKSDLSAEQGGYILVEETALEDASRTLGAGKVIWTSPQRVLYGKDRLCLVELP